MTTWLSKWYFRLASARFRRIRRPLVTRKKCHQPTMTSFKWPVVGVTWPAGTRSWMCRRKSKVEICINRCSHEYIDLYTEIPDSVPIDLIHTSFGGRYCGQIPPRRRVSLYRTIVLGFFTDKNATSEELFQGSYFFIKDGTIPIDPPTSFWVASACYRAKSAEPPSLIRQGQIHSKIISTYEE